MSSQWGSAVGAATDRLSLSYPRVEPTEARPRVPSFYGLEVARATHLGRLALGSTFMWSDLAYYAAGASLAGLWLGVLPFRAPRERDAVLDFVRPMGVRP